MSRRRRSGPDLEDYIRASVGVIVLLAFALGGIAHFAEAVWTLVILVVGVAVAGGLTWLLVVAVRAYLRSRAPEEVPVRRPRLEFNPEEPARWDPARIRKRLDEIDWYQFEKFCAALLQADGFAVERRGGAQPDGGVDLVVEKEGARALIQCKHWRTWSVQEKVVRELLGSMTHFGVTQGAIYTLKGWTQPAADFADKHAITLVNGDELAASAALQLSSERLEELLNATAHHCPKCESPMVWREGNFTPFWGCSRFPRCRGKLKYSGAR